MKAFVFTGFTGYWPVGTAALVVAETERDAENELLVTLYDKGLKEQDIASWKREEVKLVNSYVRIICDGNY